MATETQDDFSINTDGLVISDYVHPHAVDAGLPVEEIKPQVLEKRVRFWLQPYQRATCDSHDTHLCPSAFPLPNTTLVTAHNYGFLLWGKIAKLVTKLEDGKTQHYFLKIIPVDNPGRQICEGEFESLKAMYAVVPKFMPKVYKWGHLKSGPGYFLLAEFRQKSPNGKFGFHIPTFHGNLPTYTGWEGSWTVMYCKILARAMDIDQSKGDPWPDIISVRKLLFDRVIPRLLDPSSTQGRSIKPCLVHGDLWDENCAIDMATGEPLPFDADSLYAHNEYEIGYWRPPRHRLSNKAYVKLYKRFSLVSESADEWDDRNLLCSMRFNIGCNVLIPSSGQLAVVFEDMKTLCRKFCPSELSEINSVLNTTGPNSVIDGEELEYEDEETKASLDNTATEMALMTNDLLAGLHADNDGIQTMPAEAFREEMPDLKSHAEPRQTDLMEDEKHPSAAKEVESQTKDASAIETNAEPSKAPADEAAVVGKPADEPATYHTSATDSQTAETQAGNAKDPFDDLAERQPPEAPATEAPKANT